MYHANNIHNNIPTISQQYLDYISIISRQLPSHLTNIPIPSRDQRRTHAALSLRLHMLLYNQYHKHITCNKHVFKVPEFVRSICVAFYDNQSYHSTTYCPPLRGRTRPTPYTAPGRQPPSEHTARPCVGRARPAPHRAPGR